ncbi:hypothetical protein SAMN04487904_10348 [Actinopolyspora lacussalsi subsp. righensis]|uniref:DUF1737 domain-containing protein n=1 Tax=Actinopolyspora righensis TaxID=995060 RepID=A0A1I6YP31_9ACTN|nr:DUF1737 domain-containing protein [Actinopolyspora righensis]SFT52217.1 hypothetical protein SAMN04487904_10348 [Actinopolyspora righensis]
MQSLRYRFITGSADDAEFCRRISALLDEDYVLHGSPCMSYDGKTTIVGQALVLPNDDAANS